MRLIPPVWCLAFGFSLALGLCHAQDPGIQLYDIDWNGPPHQVDRPTATRGSIKSPSQVVFGQMYVRSSIGALTDRPLEMSQGEATYDQFELICRVRATRYVLDFDMTHTGSSNLALLMDHTNTGVLRVDMSGDGTVSYYNGTYKSGTYTVTPLTTGGSYDARSVTHFQLEYDKDHARIYFRINGVTKAEWRMNDVSTAFDLESLRFSSTGQDAIGVDNVKVRAYGSLSPVYLSPESLDFGTTIAGIGSTQTFRLENASLSMVTLTAVESSSPVFSLVGRSMPINIPAGGREALTLRALPATEGSTQGTFTLRTTAGNLPLAVRVDAVAAVVTQPTSQILQRGLGLSLVSSVTSAGTVLYEWTHNDILVPGARTPFLSIPSVTMEQAGIYRMIAVLPSGQRITSPPAYVAVVDALQLVHSADFDTPLTLTCRTAEPYEGALKYTWLLNGQSVTSGMSGVMLTGNRLEIARLLPIHAGTYICRVTMANPNNQQITFGNGLVATVSLPELPTITTTQLPAVQVGELVDVQLTTSAPVLRFHATGLPPGIVLNEQTGRLTGTPLVAQPTPATPYRVEFQIVGHPGLPGTSKILDWWVLAPLETGTYVGLIGRDYLADPDGQGGTFRLTVTAKGKVSGRVTVGRRSASGVGQIQTVTQKGAYEALLNLKPPFSPVSITLLPYGRLPATEFPLNEGLTGWPLVPKEKAAAFIGHLPTFMEVPSPGGPGGGAGFIHLRVNRSGTATWTGVMPNGMAVTGSQPLRADWQSADRVQVPFYWLPKGMKSSVLGWLALEGENVDGGLDWGYTQAVGGNAEIRENGIGDGFERCEIVAVGSRHTPPPRGSILLGLDRFSQTVQLAPEGPRGVSMHGLIQVLPGHRVIVSDPSQFPFPGMQIKINPTTSSFSGSYIATRLQGFPIRSTFQGIFESRTGEGLGVLRSVVIPEQPSGPVKLSSIRTQVGSIRITPYR